MKFSECLMLYCIGGIEFEDGDEAYQTVTAPSQGREIQFDDPQHDSNLNSRPYNTTPQRSPVPEYTEHKPQVEVIELDDGFINENKELAESLRQQNTNCSTDTIHLSIPKTNPLPIEICVTTGNSEVPEISEERRVDKGMDPYRICHDPAASCHTLDIESPQKLEPEPEMDTPPKKRLGRFKRFKRFVRRLCCWASEPEPSRPKRSPSPQMADVTTVHVFRSYSETDTCRAIKDLRVRRRSCSF